MLSIDRLLDSLKIAPVQKTNSVRYFRLCNSGAMDFGHELGSSAVVQIYMGIKKYYSVRISTEILV